MILYKEIYYMYGIDIFDSIKLELDWYIIYYGIKHNLLGIESAREYVFKKLKENETLSEEEFELSWKIKDLLEVLETIEKIPNIQLNSKKQMEIGRASCRERVLI